MTEQGSFSAVFHNFVDANGLPETLQAFAQVKDILPPLENEAHFALFERLRLLQPHLPLTRDLFHSFDTKLQHADYTAQPCKDQKVLIVGAGPGGLRAAIEMALLGASVLVLEQREQFSRNNVLLIWDATIHDLKALAGKFFYKKLCSGDINHISIRQLQLILLKIALLLGVEVVPGVAYKQASPSGNYWTAIVEPEVEAVKNFECNVLIGADGEHSKLIPEFGFELKTLQHGTSIGITANFINHHTQEELNLREFGLIRYANREMFDELHQLYDLEMENLVYYRDDTHYFVMTPKKDCLLRKGVLIEDKPDLASLTDRSNVDKEKLKQLAREVADYVKLPASCEFASNALGEEDTTLFDFSKKHRCIEAAKVVEQDGKKLIVCIIGDALVAPFWPQGTGANRAFMSAIDTASFVKHLVTSDNHEEALKHRAEAFTLQQNCAPNNLKEHNKHTLEPMTRYSSGSYQFNM